MSTPSSASDKLTAVLKEHRALRRSYQSDDWHGIIILGARASITFVFTVPIVLIVGEYFNRFGCHNTVPVVENFATILWICAGAMATLLTVAIKLGAKHDQEASTYIDAVDIEPIALPGSVEEDVR